MMPSSRAAFFLLGLATSASAQTFTGMAAVDSAAVARAAYGRATRADDLAIARREADRAATAWPTQQAYLWARALLAARAGDSTAALAALDDYASLSIGRDIHSSKEFAFLRASPRFAALTAAHARNRAPIGASRVVRQLDDAAFWPEAVDHDAQTGSYYLGSVRRGTVVRIDSLGRARELWPRDSMRAGAVLGVRVDAPRRALWITTSGIPQWEGFQSGDTALATLMQVGLDDGRILRRWDFPAARNGHVLGDLAVASNGDVFITDSNHPVLYRLRASGDTLEATTSPLFNSLQGVAPTPDGRSLYLADYSHGLIHMDLASGRLTRVADASRSTSLGCDGLMWYRGSLVAVQNGVAPARVVRFHLDPAGLAIARAEIIDRNSLIADEPTIGTIVGNEFVYVANSQWDKHDARGVMRPGAVLVGPTLLGVILK